MDISNNNQSLYDLPDSWEWVTANDICSSVRDGTHDTPKYVETGIPLITSKNLKEHGLDFSNVKNISLEDHQAISVRSGVEKGDILFAMIGTIGNPVIIRTDKIFSIKNVGLFKKNEQAINSEYLKYWLSSLIIKKIIDDNGFLKGTTQKFIPLGHLRIFPIPLPPINEQKRIVEKIEELFTKLDAGIELLRKLQVKLKRYRQSVLKSAVEGKLTEQWRQANQANLEPAEILLKRILQERREKWEAEQVGKKTAKYQEPIQPDISDLPDLPEGWCWASIEQLLIKIQYGSSSKTDENENGIPVLRMGNIVDGKLILNDLKYLPNDHSDFPELLLQSHDLLFNRTNSFELVGKTSVYQGHPNPCSFASYLIRVRFNNKIKSKYISFFINSMYGRKWIISVVSQQVGQANVNGTKLKALKIPLPPLQEQNKIVEEIDRIFSVTDQLEKIIERNIKRAEKLRQSILKQAFTGKLVPQDINDEPASKLLEKIKQEKAKSQPKKKTTKRSKGNS